MLGEWSSLVLQFGVAVVVVLALIGLVFWLVRRYTAGGLGRIGRGRVPRLAVMDALSVDTRRRLVLVRRDNVEHLILVGGPTDILVEQAIQRPRRPATKSQAIEAAAAPGQPSAETPEMPAEAPAMPAVAAAEPPENAPIPFPQVRAQAAPASQPAAQPIEQRSFFSLRRATGGHPTRLEPVSSPLPVPGADKADAPPASQPAVATVEAPPVRANERINGEDQEPRVVNAAPTNVSPFAAPTPAPRSEETAARVSDLEREMARLLGEITGRQSS